MKIKSTLYTLLLLFFCSLANVVFAAGEGLGEGVWDIEGTKVIIDFTDPSGSISANESVSPANAFELGAPPNDYLVKPDGEDIKLSVTAHDNFEEEGSFKEWNVTRKSGVTDWGTTPPTCNGMGAYSNFAYTIGGGKTNGDYGDNMEVTDSGYETNGTKCYQYQLSIEDQAGNELTPSSESDVVFIDKLNPWIQVSGSKTQAKSKIDFETNKVWDNTAAVSINIKVGDDETGLKSVSCQRKLNSEVVYQDCSIDPDSYFTYTEVSALDEYTYSMDANGKHEIKIVATDNSNNAVVGIIHLWWDNHNPVISITYDDVDKKVLADQKVVLTGTANDENGTVQVSEINSTNVTVEIKKCNKAPTSTCDKNIDAEWDIAATPSWMEDNVTSLTAGTNKIVTRQSKVILKHSKYYDNGTFQGTYIIKYNVVDEAGNSSISILDPIIVYPTQIFEVNTTPSANCNDNTWKANASDECITVIELLDEEGNPLYDRQNIKIQLHSETNIDQVHNIGESIFIVDGASHVSEITNQQFIENNGTKYGLKTVKTVAYAPEESLKTVTFTVVSKLHSASTYPSEDAGVESFIADTINYKVKTLFEYPNSWLQKPDVYTMGDDLLFEINNPYYSGTPSITNTIGAQLSRLGIYVHDTDDGSKYTHVHSSTYLGQGMISASTDTWLIDDGDELELADALDRSNLSDTILWMGGDDASHSYKFTLRFDKVPGVMIEGDNEATIIPVVHYGLNNKEVSYFNKNSGIIIKDELINVATAKQKGAGLAQGTGNIIVEDDLNQTAMGTISINEVSSYIKERVKKDILNLNDSICPVLGCTIKKKLSDSDDGFTAPNLYLINNSRSYVVKGDNKNLVIDGDIAIGDEPIAFITYGGNIIIRGNVRYAAGSKEPTIAFIALRNEQTGVGGNILISNKSNTTAVNDPVNGLPLNDPKKLALTRVVGSLLAERAILAVDENDNDDTDFTNLERKSNFTNQLVIQGNIMSKNTMGGGVPTYKCPSFIKMSACDSNEAQKYDLNFLRRYVKGYDIPLDATFDGTDNVQNQKYIKETEEERPVVIEYYINKESMPNELK